MFARGLSGRVVITPAVEEWLLEKLAVYGAGNKDLEPGDDLEEEV